VTANQIALSFTEVLRNAYRDQFEDQTFSQDYNVREGIVKEAEDAISVQNRYTKVIIDNNRKMIDLIRENFAYVDPDDFTPLQEFILDCTRLDVESEGNEPVLPIRIKLNVPTITFYRPDFVDFVRAKFWIKQNELKKISGAVGEIDVQKILAGRSVSRQATSVDGTARRTPDAECSN
jgi:hypothetical protein